MAKAAHWQRPKKKVHVIFILNRYLVILKIIIFLGVITGKCTGFF